MSVFKPFITSDVIVSPFKVNKEFTFNGLSSLTGSGIDFYTADYSIPHSPWVSGSSPTGYVSTQDAYLVYRSIQQLYYSNYLSGSNGSPVNTASFNPDGTITGPFYEPNYYNYPPSTLPANKIFPTPGTSTIYMLSIPSNLFGEYIKPGSFTFSNLTIPTVIQDDGEGNLISGSLKVGDIVYEHGMVIFTGDYDLTLIDNMIGPDLTCSFNSTITIYETQYKCTIRQNEFNFSQNPTLISGSSNSGIVYDFATGSYFDPYVTTVGLYNNNKELLAVAKLAQPLPLSSVTDMNIMVNLDF